MFTRTLSVLTLTGLLAAGQAGAAGGVWRPMDRIISDANAAACGHDYTEARASVRVEERTDGTSRVTFRVWGARPHTLHTVWLKLAGASPLTGAGATPAAGTGDVEAIADLAGTMSAAGTNAFTTNASGHALVQIDLDFRPSDGLYPFSRLDPVLPDVPLGHAPFTFRIVSHCADGLQHGLVPGPHEPTFQISF